MNQQLAFWMGVGAWGTFLALCAVVVQLVQPLSEDPRAREARDVMRLRQLAVVAGARRA